MFSLIRRISYSVIPRPDRPWEDDPTSNAPNPRRKRRLSSTEREAAGTDEEQARKKKIRGESTENLGSDNTVASPVGGAEDAPGAAEEGVTVHREGSLEVKVVTKGVKEVELGDKESVTQTTTTSDDKGPEDVEGTTAGAETKTKPDADAAANAGEGNHGVDAVVNPENVPLPEEEADELDELRSSPPAPQPEQQEDSTAAAEPTEASKTDTGAPSRPDTPRLTRSSSPRKLRSSSPKKVSTKA